jgi:hypothetical protein
MTTTITKLNKNQIAWIKHALKNQNRFYTDRLNKDWNDLVEKGYAIKRAGWEDDMAYFRVTPEGEKVFNETR